MSIFKVLDQNLNETLATPFSKQIEIHVVVMVRITHHGVPQHQILSFCVVLIWYDCVVAFHTVVFTYLIDFKQYIIMII